MQTNTWTPTIPENNLRVMAKDAATIIRGATFNHENKSESTQYDVLRQAFLNKSAVKVEEKTPTLFSAMANVVRGVKSFVLNTFLHKYYGEKNFQTANSVVTVTDKAFEKAGINLDQVIANQDLDTKFQTVKDQLMPFYTGAEDKKGLEYFNWLDLQANGELQTNLQETKTAVQEMKARYPMTDALVFGMGGSSMNGKLLRDTFPEQNDVNVDVVDNMDPGALKTKLDNLHKGDKKPTYIFISKSGGTFEVKHMLQRVIDYIKENETEGNNTEALKHLAERSIFVTEPYEHQLNVSKKVGALNKVVKELNENEAITIKPTVISHPPRVGGRYSLLSVVGMLVSELKGLKSEEFLKGAKACVDEFFKAESIKDCDAAKIAVLDTELAKHPDYAASFVATYGEDLQSWPEFTGQLAGESNNKGDSEKADEPRIQSLLQKNGRFPTGHHSDVEAACRTTKGRVLVKEYMIRDNNKDHVHGDSGLKALGDIKHQSMHEAMLTELAMPFSRHIRDKKGVPVITTVLDKKDEYNIGYLAMRDMLTTIIQAGLQDELITSVKQAEVERMKREKSQDKSVLELENIRLAA